MEVKKLDLTKEFYHEAHEKGFTGFEYLEQQDPTEPELKEALVERYHEAFGVKERGGAQSGYSQKVREFAENMGALTRHLAALGIKVSGPGADRLEKFFATTATASIFPSYFEAQVYAGLLRGSLVPQLVARTITSASDTVKIPQLEDTAQDRQLREVSEGAELPRTKITTGEHTITLRKYGRMLEGTYEALRRQATSIDLFGLMLQRIGQQVGLDETDELIEVAIAGDGNNNAVVDTDAEVSGTLDYDELVRLAGAFVVPYKGTDAVVNWTNLRTILNMAEFKDPMAGFNFQRTGVLPGPLGWNWHRWDSTGSPSFSTDRILVVDRNVALVEYNMGNILSESDRLIDRQIERATVSKWVAFAKFDPAGTQCLDIVTS